jgi:hypothetical protein
MDRNDDITPSKAIADIRVKTLFLLHEDPGLNPKVDKSRIRNKLFHIFKMMLYIYRTPRLIEK